MKLDKTYVECFSGLDNRWCETELSERRDTHKMSPRTDPDVCLGNIS